MEWFMNICPVKMMSVQVVVKYRNYNKNIDRFRKCAVRELVIFQPFEEVNLNQEQASISSPDNKKRKIGNTNSAGDDIL